MNRKMWFLRGFFWFFSFLVGLQCGQKHVLHEAKIHSGVGRYVPLLWYYQSRRHGRRLRCRLFGHVPHLSLLSVLWGGHLRPGIVIGHGGGLHRRLSRFIVLAACLCRGRLLQVVVIMGRLSGLHTAVLASSSLLPVNFGTTAFFKSSLFFHAFVTLSVSGVGDSCEATIIVSDSK